MRTLPVGIALLLLAGLALFQHEVMEKTPEKREENVYTQLADLPARDMLPSYIGSLFLGSFRAVAVDALWIQLKEAQEQRRFYQAREITEMISALQPRNQQVWVMLAWDSAYNVANSEAQLSEERAWTWIRYGILKLREGIRRNPRSAYLRYELALLLLHKPSWQEGKLDMGFLRRVEADDEIQRQLQDPRRELTVLKERKTAFELAIVWFREVVRELAEAERRGIRTYRSQMGLLIAPDTMEGLIRESLFFQGIYEWRLAELRADSPHWARAAQWFRRAEEQTNRILRLYAVSPIFEDYRTLYRKMDAVLAAARERTRAQATKDPRAGRRALLNYVRVLEEILKPLGRVGSGHLSDPLSQGRRELSRETYGPGRGEFTDRDEFNDTIPFATPIGDRDPVHGNLRPAGDVDTFVAAISPPPPHPHDRRPAPFRPRTATVSILRLGTAPIEVRVLRKKDVLLASALLREVAERRLEFTVDRPGAYYIEVRLADPRAPLPADTRYRLRVAGLAP